MRLGKAHACWTVPDLTIDCMLARVHRQLEADGCVLKINGSSSQVAAPDQLTPGDFVKVRLWLDDGSASINIGLAEIRQVQDHWITVEVIHVGRHERARLQQYIEAHHSRPAGKPVLLDHLVIRA